MPRKAAAQTAAKPHSLSRRTLNLLLTGLVDIGPGPI